MGHETNGNMLCYLGKKNLKYCCRITLTASQPAISSIHPNIDYSRSNLVDFKTYPHISQDLVREGCRLLACTARWYYSGWSCKHHKLAACVVN